MLLIADQLQQAFEGRREAARVVDDLMPVAIGHPHAVGLRLVGDQVPADDVRRVEDLGATTYTVGPSAAGLRGTKDDFLDWIKRVADDVMTKL